MKVLIVDDQKLLRDCLKHAIEKFSDFQVVASVDNGEEAVQICSASTPDLVLMDIVMPVCDGIEATRRIKEINSNIKIMMLTSSQDLNDVEIAMQNGADGYVLKSIGSEELILAMKSMALGLDIIHKDVYKVASRSKEVKSEKKVEKEIKLGDFKVLLSQREITIVNLIAQGKDTSYIAHKLFLTEGRVRNIITEIISKLFLKDKAQLVAFAYMNGLVDEQK